VLVQSAEAVPTTKTVAAAATDIFLKNIVFTPCWCFGGLFSTLMILPYLFRYGGLTEVTPQFAQLFQYKKWLQISFA
jgi:hypothetical protein